MTAPPLITADQLAEATVASAESLVAAERTLFDDRRGLNSTELLELQALPDDQLGNLAALAHRVRMEFCGDAVTLEGIVSGKTGGCLEDCHFCSQSSTFNSDVAPTRYIPFDQLMRAAHETQAGGATEFCIVYAVRGPDERLMDHVLNCIDLIQRETFLDVHCSLGLLNRDQAQQLADAGVGRYNHNLETSQSNFPNVCTTHSWQDRLATCELVHDVGMELCCGGIIGLGESREQRIEFAVELAALNPAEVPINFLNPRPGTPFADYALVDAAEAIRTLALFRLALPKTTIRYAGGREITLGDLQSLGLQAGVNGMITGNYLTTLGQTIEQDLAMLDDLKMSVKTFSQTL